MSDYEIEHVLILQGGGSLGAFGCGVFKALANNNIKIDIVAGTPIGAAIIAGSKGGHPEEELEVLVGTSRWRCKIKFPFCRLVC